MSAYLQITLKIKNENRAEAAAVYGKYKQPFLDGIAGAKSKELLIRHRHVGNQRVKRRTANFQQLRICRPRHTLKNLN